MLNPEPPDPGDHPLWWFTAAILAGYVLFIAVALVSARCGLSF